MAQSQDVVGVFDSNGNELFPNARAIRALVNPPARAMKHPLETGASVTDHIVFDPIQIELGVILDPVDYQDTYQQILNLFKAPQTVTILTKTSSYQNMLMTAPPYDEVPEMFDTIAVAMKFEEAIFVQAQYAQLPATSVAKKSNASTVKTGQQTATPATPDAAQSIASYLGSLF
jgi:hypothetical protein